MSDDDMQDGFYVNFSDEEASSEARDIEPLPSGKYLCRITDVEMRESKSEKNNGKPYYAIEFTVVGDRAGDQFVGRKCWTNAMLFPPALYTISHIMKALGFPVNAGPVRIPEPSELIDRVVVVGGIKTGEQKDKNDPSKTYPPKFEPKSIFGEEKWSDFQKGVSKAGGVAVSKGSSLLS